MNENDPAFVAESAKTFYEELQNDKNGRFRSWEHCYKRFYDVIKNDKKDVDVDYLSLHLAFYLASWGMYRGSSFLLQKDYKVHTDVVKEILKPEYDDLLGMKCGKVEENWGKIENLKKAINDIYVEKCNRTPTDTLVTKILMGTLGCVPAYDRFFVAGIKELNIAKGKFDGESLKNLADFYVKNIDKFENLNFQIDEIIPYPQMKILDMGFWKIGFDISPKKENILD